MKKTIFWQYAVPISLIITLALGSLGLLLADFFSDSFESNLQNALIEEARLIANQVAEPIRSGEIQGLQSLVQSISESLDARVTLIGLDGSVLADSQADPTLMENHINRPEILRAMQGQEASISRISDTVLQRMLYSAVPIRSTENDIVGVARLSLNLDAIENQMDQVRNLVFGIAGLVLGISLLGVFITTQRLLKPIIDLSHASHNMSENKEVKIPHTHRQDEIGQLADSLQTMANYLNQRIQLLEEEQTKLNAILDNISDGILIFLEDESLVSMNPAAAILFGIEQSNGSSPNLTEIVRDFEIIALFKKCLDVEETQTIVKELSPERKYVQVILSPLLTDKTSKGVLVLIQDLTRLKKLEEIRRDFVSNVSHELRTPLASLKALVDTLEQGALNDPPVALRFLGMMAGEIDNLTQMVEELLELSKIESGKVPLSMEKVDPREFAFEAVERMKLQAERAKINLSVKETGNLPSVLMDRSRMAQVMVNLLHNAIKFTSPGGEIMVSITKETDHLEFHIQDTGTGMSDEDLKRVFERFYKADRSRTGRGTGLGLSICRHLIEAHNGKIWAESEQGRGSVFHFSLPLFHDHI